METDSQTQKSRGNKNTVAVSSETPLSSSAIISLSPVEAMELLLSKIKKTIPSFLLQWSQERARHSLTMFYQYIEL
jgi:hypothetical protein